MKIHRVFALAALSASLFPSIASAQSFWLHVQHAGSGTIGAEAQLLAVDSNDCFLAQGQPDFEILTRDYWSSWHFVITDSPGYNMRKHSTFGGFVHPSHNLIVIGYNDWKVGHIVRSSDGGETWKDTTIGSYTMAGLDNSVVALGALDSNHIVALIDSDANWYTDHFILSSNGGLTWRSLSTPDFSYDPSSSGMPTNPVVSYLRKL